MRSKLPLVFIVIGLAGCVGVYYPGACHDNFKTLHQASVGQSIENPNNWFFRYRAYYSEYQTLPNGHVEYVTKRRGSCRGFYEIDPKSETVVGWRFEGSTEDCAICP